MIKLRVYYTYTLRADWKASPSIHEAIVSISSSDIWNCLEMFRNKKLRAHNSYTNGLRRLGFLRHGCQWRIQLFANFLKHRNRPCQWYLANLLRYSMGIMTKSHRVGIVHDATVVSPDNRHTQKPIPQLAKIAESRPPNLRLMHMRSRI